MNATMLAAEYWGNTGILRETSKSFESIINISSKKIYLSETLNWKHEYVLFGFRLRFKLTGNRM